MNQQDIAFPDVTGEELPEAKQKLRVAVRKAREQRGRAEKVAANRQWVDTALEFIEGSTTVAAYISVANEPGTRELCEEIIARGYQLLVPKLGPRLSRQWAWYTGEDDLSAQAPGRPPAPSGEAIDSDILASVECIIMPALMVNSEGYRLGQGGGWYDRVLKEVPETVKIGAMVFPEEFVDSYIPHDELDMKVDYAILPDHIVKL